MSTEGRVAIVTGASRGIGLAVVKRLLTDGCTVIAGSRSSSAELDELAAAGRVHFVAADLSQPGAAEQLAAAAGDRIDILVNNVGATKSRVDGFLSITDEDWLTSMTLNFFAAVRMTRAVLPSMLAASSGSIVNVCSVNAFLPDPGVMDYSAAKAALLNFAKSLSKEVGPSGIRVNSVDPGPVATDLWLGATGVAETVGAAKGVTPQQVAESALSGTATKRFTQPSEVADVVAFLADDRLPNLTGSAITIDGGLTQTL
jgi:NAD(P)-dependent dehydrogenase (short-subunit alcohol dehydrogenase family)